MTLTASQSVVASEIAARVVTVRGDVVKYGEWNLTQKTPLKPNDTILEGDTIETKNGAAAKLLFTDRTIVDIGSDTTFRIKEYRLKQGRNRDVNFELKEGKVRTSVNQPVGQSGSFRLKTRSVVMGVRGTEFVVESHEALLSGAGSAGMVPTQITVLEGNVAVAQTTGSLGAGAALNSANLQSVSAGQQLTAGLISNGIAAPGGLPAERQQGTLQTLSPGQAAAVAQSATVVDQTFKAAVNLESSSDSKSESKSEGKPSSDSPREAGAAKPAALAQLAAAVQASAAAIPPRIDVANLGVPGANSGPPLPGQQNTNFSVVGQPTTVRIRFNP